VVFNHSKIKMSRRAPNRVCPLPQQFDFWLLRNNTLKQEEGNFLTRIVEAAMMGGGGFLKW
jgi:hypothetical protein